MYLKINIRYLPRNGASTALHAPANDFNQLQQQSRPQKHPQRLPYRGLIKSILRLHNRLKPRRRRRVLLNTSGRALVEELVLLTAQGEAEESAEGRVNVHDWIDRHGGVWICWSRIGGWHFNRK